MSTLADAVVFLVEDDAALAQATIQALELEGADVTHFGRGDAALAAIDRDFAGVVVSDIRLPRMDGMVFFERLRAIDDAIPVILVTGHGDIDTAVDAMRDGAFDFLTKPFASERLSASISQAMANRALVLENRLLRDRLDRSRAIPGESVASERLRNLVASLAKADVDVVIEGASGTGKSFIARLLHELGPRASRPVVIIDAGTVLHPDAELLLFGRDPAGGLSHTGLSHTGLSHTGLIERARGGTLVLDEIESVGGAARARLKSLVETRAVLPLGADRSRNVDLRIIEVLPSGMSFDSDSILHRASPIQIALPCLNEREGDIMEFFSLFLARHEGELGIECDAIGSEVLNHVRSHDWPGNLRELDSYAKSFVLGARTSADRDDESTLSTSLRDQVAEFERTVIETALRHSNGSIADAEKILSLPTKTLYDKLSRHGLKPKNYRR